VKKSWVFFISILLGFFFKLLNRKNVNVPKTYTF
jgi:hypothetical protein